MDDRVGMVSEEIMVSSIEELVALIEDTPEDTILEIDLEGEVDEDE